MRRSISRSAFALLVAAGPALADGFGGPLTPADPGAWRFDLTGGGSVFEFTRFRYGDVRNVFPVFGGPFLGDYFNERGSAGGYNIGGRASFGLPTPIFGMPPEVYGRFNYSRAAARSDFNETDSAPEVYVPYIDGQVRTTLTGGAIVGLFTNSSSELKRTLTSYDAEAGIRFHTMVDGWNVAPGVFFNYQRLEQRDRLFTTGIIDPTVHTLAANVTSDHFRIGGSLRVARPVFTDVVIFVANVAGGIDFVRARYNGTQTFAGSVFDLPFEQFAAASDSRNRIGGFVGAEAGLTYWLFPAVSISVMGNARYLTSVPYVRYPAAITGTNTVTGPASLSFQGMFIWGGNVVLSIKM